MFAEGEVGFCFISQILMRRSEPGLGAFPLFLKRSIEIVRAEGPVAVSEQEARRAEMRFEGAQRTQRQIAIIAIRHEAGGKIPREPKLLLPPRLPERRNRMLLIETEIPGPGEQAEFAGLERLRPRIDHAADRVRTIERGTRPFQHFETGDHFQRDRQIEIEVSGLHVVDAQAIEQDQSLPERRAANRQIPLKASRDRLVQVERGIEPQEIEPGFVERALLLRQAQDAHVAIRLGQRNGLGGSGNDYALGLRRRGLLGRKEDGAQGRI